LKAIHILENGRILRQMGTEFIFGQMEIDTKENGDNALNMGSEQIYLQMVKLTLENSKMVNLKVKGHIIGLMGRSTKVSFIMVKEKEKEHGKRIGESSILTHIKENTKQIWSTGMVFLNGSQEILMKVVSLKMNERVTGKCIGLTVLFTKETGKKVCSMAKVKWFSLLEM